MTRIMRCWMICEEVRSRYAEVVKTESYETDNAMWACIGAANAAAEIQCKIADILFPLEDGKEATPAQITTALGTLIDKWASISGGPSDNGKEGELSKSLREMVEELESDG